MMYSKDSSEENGTKFKGKGGCRVAIAKVRIMELSVIEKMNVVTVKIWAECLGFYPIIESKNSIEFSKVGEPDVVAYLKGGRVYRVETL